MSKTGVAVSMALAVLLALGVSPAIAKFERYRSDGWTLKVRHDRFTGQTRCALASSKGRLRYQPGAIGFLLGKHRDTLTAWYRIDDGAPVRWQDRSAALIVDGVAIDGPALDNATGGLVWVPVAELAQARTVAIRTDERSRVHHFRLAGFQSMLAAARRLGCGSDDAFRI